MSVCAGVYVSGTGFGEVSGEWSGEWSGGGGGGEMRDGAICRSCGRKEDRRMTLGG
jgi:hypothetical protein